MKVVVFGATGTVGRLVVEQASSKVTRSLRSPATRLGCRSNTSYYRSHRATSPISTKLKISRADVADFLVGQLTDATYLHRTPAISY